MKIRTRFAPSPTGGLHAGTVRTALFAWLAARHAGGEFILRIEDTDRTRHVENGLKNIIDSLKYLGIDWDEGPDVGGSGGPYIQSKRLDVYNEWAKKLMAAGRAYADPYTSDQVQAFRDEAQKDKQPFLFRNHRPAEPPTWDGSQPLRFKSEPKNYNWHDEVMGNLATGPEVVDDFILIKSDGFPTYNFAHIVDDELMKVNLVVRSQEFISSMPIFLNLYEALGFSPPAFATVPMVLGSSGNQKLSKRHGAKQLLDYQKVGILPEALMNALATTGWNDGTEQEIFSRDELIRKFNLSRVQRSAARFDEKRLEWMNGHYIRELPFNKLANEAENFWPPEAEGAEPKYTNSILKLVQERLKYLAELPELTRFFFVEPELDRVHTLYKKNGQLKNIDGKSHPEFIKVVIDSLQDSDFSEDDIKLRLNDLLVKLDTKPAILFSIVRIAITGTQHSPELFGTLAVLGKTKTLSRLQKALDGLND